MTDSPKIAIIGGWHQACVLAGCFAEMQYQVTGIVTPDQTERLAAGKAPLFEPGLDELLQRNLHAGRLRYTSDYPDGLRGVDFAFISIDTPVDSNDESDLAPIRDAVNALSGSMTGPLTVVVTAQVPIGTCDGIRDQLSTGRHDQPIPVVYVPEFLRLGTALQSFREADRFVIGADDPVVAEKVASLYRPLQRPIHRTDVHSAEMGKHAANTFLATSISFINQIADLCEVTGADVTQVAAIMKLDRRIGSNAFLSAGLGYAGGTLGREIRALQQLGATHQVETVLLDSVDRINGGRTARLIRRVKTALSPIRGQRVGILGLAYKAGTSTLRRSVAVEIANRLQADGARVAAFDPLVSAAELDGIELEFSRDPEEVSRGAAALIIMVPWEGLTVSALRRWRSGMDQPLIFDTGNYLPAAEVVAAGFVYYGVGR
jgi:UDPglucose 6-dehydrogenase